jgi:very-short-patch-repair endonuclease
MQGTAEGDRTKAITNHDRILMCLLEQNGCGNFVRELAFAMPRRWRFDFSWPIARVALELDGGVWSLGRHTRGQGFINDCEKMSEAAARGWRVLRLTTQDVEQRPVYVVDVVRRALQWGRL